MNREFFVDAPSSTGSAADGTSTVGTLGDGQGAIFKHFKLRGFVDASLVYIPTAHGIESRRAIFIEGIGIQHFGGHAIFINGQLSVADCGEITNSQFRFNRGDGIRMEGLDSQVWTIANNQAFDQIGVGFHDQSFIGNNWKNNHGRGNHGGDFRSRDYPCLANFDMCYSEGIFGEPAGLYENKIGNSSVVIGGTLAGDGLCGLSRGRFSDCRNKTGSRFIIAISSPQRGRLTRQHADFLSHRRRP